MKKEKLFKKRGAILLLILFLLAIVFPAASGGSPDLTVTYPVQFSPSSVTQGGSITVTWTEMNQGTGDAGPYGVGVYLGVSEYGRDYLLGHFSRSGLGAGQSASYTASFTIPQSVPEGSYYVTVFIDDINYVSESNENNNIGSSTPSKVNVASNTGTIRVIAQYVDGVAASNAKVYVDGQLKGYTDSSGTLTVSVPAGSHSVQVSQDVMGITNKYVSDSVSVPIGTCVDANVVLKCQGGCVEITGGSASPSSAKPGDTVTVTVKYVFFHCCSGCCVVEANAFGDWAKTTQLAVVHDGCEGTFHTEITKTFTFTLPATISPGTHYVRVGFNYDYSFKSSYDDLASTEHIDIPISVAAPSYVLTVNVKHADGSAVSGAYVCAGGTCAYADSYGTASLTLQQGTYTVKATKDYDISGTKISYYGDQSVTVTGNTSIDLNVMPQGGCFYLRSFQLSKSSLNPGETVSGSAEWVFAKCCPSCIVYAVVYDQAGKEVARLWQGGDSGYTHQVITKTFTYTAPSTPGTYCLTLNVAYDYSPPGPSQGITGKTCFTVSQQTVLDGQITGVNPSSVSVSPDQSVQFTFTVKNTGNIVSDYHVYFPDGSLFGYVSGTITLNPGQQGQITLTGTVPSGAQPGSYSVDVYFEMAQHGQPWQKTQKWGSVQVNVQGPQPGYIRATITNNDDDTLDVYLYIDGALRLSALSRPPGSTFTSDPISVQGNTQHTVTIKWRDPDTSQEYSKSVNVYVPQGQTVTATLTIDLHTAGSPKLEITHNFPSQVTSGNTFSVTVTVRNSGTADATNVASGISWGGDAFSSLGCTGTWRKDRLAPGEAMQYTCSLKAGKPGTYTVEVSAVADSGVSAKSTVQVVVLEAKDTTPPSVKVLAPAGGESLTPGSTYRIKWQATDNVAVAKITIYLYQTSGLASVIASNIQNTGYYDWTVPDNPGSYFIRIVAVDTSGNTGTADSQQFTIAQIQQKQPPALALGNPQINGLTVTISGTATPGYTGATITRIHWDWGDGKSEDTWLPATHTYTTPGIYTVTVTVYQSDGLSVARILQVNLESAPKLHITLISNVTTLVKGKSILILIVVKDPQNNPIDAITSCRISTPSGREISVDLLRIIAGVYQATFTETTEVGDYRIIAIAQKSGYVGDREELVFHVEGAYGITNINRVYYDPLKRDIIEVNGKVVKEGSNFIVDLLLANKREGYYKLAIYRSPVYFLQQTLVYNGVIGPRQVLYPIRIQTPVSDKGDSQICIDVTLSWEMETVKTIMDLFIPVQDPLPYMEEYAKFYSELTSYMKQKGYLPMEYDNMEESFQKAATFVDGFVKLCANDPNYVGNKIAEFAKGCGIHYAEEGIMDKIKAFSSKIAFIVKLMLWNWHIMSTPATEVIYVNIGQVGPSSLAPITSSTNVNFFLAAGPAQRIDNAAEFLLNDRFITATPAGASISLFEGKTVGNIDINLLKDRLTFILNASFPVPEPATFEGIDIFSVTSYGIGKGNFIVANVSIDFSFYDEEIANYFFRVVNESLSIKRSILEWSGLIDIWSSELGINGSNVSLKVSGLRFSPPRLARENWRFVIKEQQVSLNVFREMMIPNCETGICDLHLTLSPELFNVTSLYSDRIVTQLFIAPKMEISAINPKPSSCLGDPEVGYKCLWDHVPKELTLNYIIDEAPPVIAKIDQYPKKVTFEDNVAITISVFDAGVGLRNVTIFYSTDGGVTWKKLRADLVSGDVHQGLFKAIIQKQPYGATVLYKLEVYDRAGNVQYSETASYHVELANWVYALAIMALMLALAIGYAVGHRIRHRNIHKLPQN